LLLNFFAKEEKVERINNVSYKWRTYWYGITNSMYGWSNSLYRRGKNIHTLQEVIY